MYKCEKLTKRKLQQFIALNNARGDFNTLNEDFFSVYDNASFAEQIFLRNQVKLLSYDKDYIGYMWLRKYKNGHYIINAFNIAEPNHHITGGFCLVKTLKSRSSLEYSCEKNDFNFTLLSELGFKKEDGTIELIKIIDSENKIDENSLISFEEFSRGVHENVRCRLQNEIFRNNCREPLTLEDIYFDVIQEYFWDRGSIFIKHNGLYIGYGQIILDGYIPTIVNFGIINEFRSKGYGKMLLNYLINILHRFGYKQVRIKVNSNNLLAYDLYTKLGFVKVREHYNWTLVL